MQARKLKHILNDTEYIVSNNEDYIAVGSSLCHNLISVDKKTLNVQYALDTFGTGRSAIKHKEIEFIWDKLHELIATGEIINIINLNDDIINPIPVYYIRDGKLIEAATDKIEWPNTDSEGYTIYENTHFANKIDAIKYGIEDGRYGIENAEKRVKELESDFQKAKERLAERLAEMEYLKELLNS